MSELRLDRDGHLASGQAWTREIGEWLAQGDGLALTSAHWEVIEFVRHYYEQYQIAPPMRVLVRTMRRAWGPEKGSSRYLYRLFSESPARQACRYGGLPKPLGCI